MHMVELLPVPVQQSSLAPKSAKDTGSDTSLSSNCDQTGASVVRKPAAEGLSDVWIFSATWKTLGSGEPETALRTALKPWNLISYFGFHKFLAAAIVVINKSQRWAKDRQRNWSSSSSSWDSWKWLTYEAFDHFRSAHIISVTPDDPRWCWLCK